MRVFAIGDLHLSFGIQDKSMDLFGENWIGYTNKIKKSWDENVQKDDLVLIAGDISWAMKLEDAKADLEWIDSRPGVKLMVKGNHDYWWQSSNKVRKALPKSIHILANDAFYYNGVAVVGTRLWDDTHFNFTQFIDFRDNPKQKEPRVPTNKDETDRILKREHQRFLLSLSAMKKDAPVKIAMFHYPPISSDLQDSEISKILQKEHISHCIFGHLHSLKKDAKLFGKKEGVDYQLVSCDFLEFRLIKLLEITSVNASGISINEQNIGT